MEGRIYSNALNFKSVQISRNFPIQSVNIRNPFQIKHKGHKKGFLANIFTLSRIST